MSDLASIAAQIKSLTPANQLRLAADLIDKQNISMAHTIAQSVVDEMALVIHMTGRTGMVAATLPNGVAKEGT